MIKSLRALICLAGLLGGLTSVGQAQNLVTGSLPVSFVCPPGTLSVPFSATGPFGAGNTFTAQLSDESGGFTGTVTSIGSITANPASATTLTIAATIPASTPVSAVYKVRVVSSIASKSSISPTFLAIGTAAPSAASTQVFCQNSGPQNVTAVGQSLTWYLNGSTTAVAGTGVNFPVSTSAVGSFTLYATQTVNSCVSTRAPISYSVMASPAAPGVVSITVCQGQPAGALSATFATGTTPNWYGNKATGGSPSTTAPVPSTATSDTYYVSQSIGSCESPRAGLSVTVGPAVAAPTVSVPMPYCSNSSPYPTATATGSGLQWYNVFGTPIGSTAPLPTAAGSYTYSVTQSNGSCISPKTTYTLTVNPKADGPLLLTLPYCVNAPPTALAVTGTNVQWFTTSAGTTVIAQPAPPTSTQTYYAQQTNASGCKSDITPVTVTVYAQPPVPAVTPSVTICSGTSATLTATALSGNTLRWYGSNPQGIYTTAPVPTTLAGPQYVAQVNSNGCVSDKAQITVFVNPVPAQPTTTIPTPVCSGVTAGPLSATATIAGATLRWYTDATASAYTTTPPTPSTLTSSTYYVAQVDPNGCVGARASVPTTVKKRPAAPTLSTAQSQVGLCQNQAAQPLTAALTDGTTLNWYDTNGTTLLNGAPTPPTTSTGTVTYQVAQVLDGCDGPRASVTATVNAIPVAPTTTPAGPYCQGTAIQPLSAVGTALKWYGTNLTGGTATASQTPDNTIPGVTPYYVTQTVKGCESTRSSVAVQVKPTPGVPGTAGVEFCQNTTPPVLTAIAMNNATLNWYGMNSTGPVSTTAPTPQNTAPASLTYYVSQLLDGCEGPKASFVVRVKPTPGAPITTPIAFCYNTPSQVLTATGQNLAWYDQNDTPLNNAPAPATNAIGNQVFKVTQTVEGCVSGKSTLTVTVNQLPDAPKVTNLQYCLPTQDQPAQTVGPLTATGQNLKWYNPDGNAYDQTPTPPINQTNVITYQVTQMVNNCEGPKATLQVAIQTTSAPVIPNPLVTYCRNDGATPLQATGTNLRWIDPNNTLLPVNTTPTPPTLNATPQGGVFYQVYQTGSNGCISPRSSIKVIINTNPTVSVLGATQIILGQTTSLQLHFTGAPPFSYTLSGGIAGKVSGDTTITVTPRQTTTYQVVDVANICGNGLPGNPASAVVTVTIPTIATGNLSSSTLCAGSAFTVPYVPQGDFNLNLGYQVQLVLTADTSARSTITLNTAGVGTNPIPVTIPSTTPGGTYFVRVIRTVSASPLIQVLGSASPTQLTVRPLPTATLLGTQNLYEGSPTNLTVTFGGDGPWTFSYADSAHAALMVSATVSPYLLSVQPLQTTTYQLTSVRNNCGTGTVSGTATVTVLPLLGVEKDPLNSVRIYPVPATTRLTVDIDRALYTESALLELIDLRGHTTLQQSTRSQQTDLDLSAHPPGIYILKVTLGDRQTTRKILKQ